jgi:hypothetical protein
MDIIYEPSKPIQISNYVNIENSEYSLKQNMFNPFKNSPPNDFIINLQKRITQFTTISKHSNIIQNSH